MKNVGKSFFFNDRKGLLMLYSNAKDLDAMERILQKCDVLLPQTQPEENPIKTDERATQQTQLPAGVAKTNLVKTSKGRQAILSKLDRIRIDYIKYDGLPLAEVINNLSEIAKTRDPDRVGINFFINREAPAAVAGAIDPTTGLPIEPVDVGGVTVKIAPALTNICLADVLDAITKASDKPIKYSVEDYAVVFSLKGPETVPLFTRAFHVDVTKFQTVIEKTMGQTFDEARNGYWEEQRKAVRPGGISNLGGDPNRAVQNLILNFLSRSGVDVDVSKMKNTGKGFFYNDRKGTIMLHSSREDLDAMERILQKSEVLLPQTQPEADLIKTNETATQQTQLPAGVAKTNLVKAVKGRKEIIAALNRIQASPTDYNGLTLQEAIAKLSQTIRSGNSNQSGVNFFIERSGPVQLPAQGKGDPASSPPPYLARENDDLGTKVLKLPQSRAEVPLAAVLDCMATNNSLQYAVEDYAVVFSVKASELAPMYTRVYHVSTNRFNSFFNRLASASPNSDSSGSTNVDFQIDLREYFKAAGVDFSPTNPANVGKSIFYKDRKGMLMVHATTQDLDRIEKALERINTPLPQINIKSRFVEIDEMAGSKIKLSEMMGGNGVKTNSIQTPVPVSTPMPLRKDPNYGSFPAVTNALAVQFTGVLTPEQYKEIMARLKQAEGVDILTPPDVTTESERQAQIQTVDIQTIVTGLTTVYTNGITTNMYSTQTLPFGPVLDIIPKVSADDSSIEMTLVANVTEFLGYDDPKKLKGQKRTDVQIPLPRFKLRQLTSSADVLDGQTVVLGGIESSIVGKPSNGKQGRRKTLLVFVTATLINADGSLYHSKVKQEAALQESK